MGIEDERRREILVGKLWFSLLQYSFVHPNYMFLSQRWFKDLNSSSIWIVLSFDIFVGVFIPKNKVKYVYKFSVFSICYYLTIVFNIDVITQDCMWKSVAEVCDIPCKVWLVLLFCIKYFENNTLSYFWVPGYTKTALTYSELNICLCMTNKM